MSSVLNPITPVPTLDSLTLASLSTEGSFPSPATSGDTSTGRSNLLRALSAEDLEALTPLLERIDLVAGQVLQQRERPITHVVLPESAVVVVRLPIDGEGGLADVMTVGCEGVIGVSALLGGDVAYEQSAVRVAGAAQQIEVGALMALLSERPALRRVFEGYARALLLQLSQLTVCARAHSLEERLAGLLLRMHDQAASTEFTCTHEQLAAMLRVRRAGVTEAAVKLRRRGVIGHGRGRLSIKDRDALLGTSCVCYRIISDHLSRTTAHAVS